MNEWEWRILDEKSPPDVTAERLGVREGDRVRLHPRAKGDVFDQALDGKTARVAAIEQDYEGNFHVSVVLDEDPGSDMGRLRIPGHRFFFAPDEVEIVERGPKGEAKGAGSVLVAGIGNIFLGDDGFGVEVVQRLAGYMFGGNVRVVDFGIRGFDLAYALMDGPEVTILVDACPHGEKPGTLFLMELDPAEADVTGSEGVTLEAHAMNPVNVLRMAKLMGAKLNRILLVGCEPMTLGDEGGTMGLSDEVGSAVDRAVDLIRETLEKVLAGQPVGNLKPREGG